MPDQFWGDTAAAQPFRPSNLRLHSTHSVLFYHNRSQPDLSLDLQRDCFHMRQKHVCLKGHPSSMDVYSKINISTVPQHQACKDFHRRIRQGERIDTRRFTGGIQAGPCRMDTQGNFDKWGDEPCMRGISNQPGWASDVSTVSEASCQVCILEARQKQDYGPGFDKRAPPPDPDDKGKGKEKDVKGKGRAYHTLGGRKRIRT